MPGKRFAQHFNFEEKLTNVTECKCHCSFNFKIRIKTTDWLWLKRKQMRVRQKKKTVTIVCWMSNLIHICVTHALAFAMRFHSLNSFSKSERHTHRIDPGITHSILLYCFSNSQLDALDALKQLLQMWTFEKRYPTRFVVSNTTHRTV